MSDLKIWGEIARISKDLQQGYYLKLHCMSHCTYICLSPFGRAHLSFLLEQLIGSLLGRGSTIASSQVQDSGA